MQRCSGLVGPSRSWLVGITLPVLTQRGPLMRPTLFTIVTERDHPTMNMLLG